MDDVNPTLHGSKITDSVQAPNFVQGNCKGWDVGKVCGKFWGYRRYGRFGAGRRLVEAGLGKVGCGSGVG